MRLFLKSVYHSRLDNFSSNNCDNYSPNPVKITTAVVVVCCCCSPDRIRCIVIAEVDESLSSEVQKLFSKNYKKICE